MYHLKREVIICPLCEREIDKQKSKHHLTPVLKGGRNKETVDLHDICHSKIHSLLTEKQLASQYNTIEKLLTNQEIQKFVKWVKTKPINFFDGSKLLKK